jgi:hypothetical protein
MSDLTRGERLQIMLSPKELSIIDDFRFKQRMPSRAAAVRELLNLGLAAFTTNGSSDERLPTKSSDYGVLGRGPDGHKVAGDSTEA